MSEGIKFLTAVVPELEDKPIGEVKRLWREWVNNQPPDVRLWLKDPLSPSQRRTLQFGFAAEYYQTRMLVAFEVTQEEKHQKMLDQDPRNRPHVPVLEAVQRNTPLLQPTSEMVKRQLTDGSVIYAETEDEADAVVAREIEKAAEEAVEIPE